MKLTVCIITLNEENNIRRCLDSIKSIADEIILVDSGSSDNTVQIAKECDAKVYINKFVDYASQKNYAASKASSEWIYFIDADEVNTKELSEEIVKAIHNEEFDAFLIPRRNILLRREIKHSRWSPDKHIWLYKKVSGKWVGDIHEEIETKGQAGELQNAKIHYSYSTVRDFVSMINRYTELTAMSMVSNGVRFSAFRLVYDPLKSFLGRYVIKSGFLDGPEGFMLALLMAYYRTTTWLKVWEKTNVKKS